MSFLLGCGFLNLGACSRGELISVSYQSVLDLSRTSVVAEKASRYCESNKAIPFFRVTVMRGLVTAEAVFFLHQIFFFFFFSSSSSWQSSSSSSPFFFSSFRVLVFQTFWSFERTRPRSNPMRVLSLCRM